MIGSFISIIKYEELHLESVTSPSISIMKSKDEQKHPKNQRCTEMGLINSILCFIRYTGIV